MTTTGSRCTECGKPVGLSSAFLAGICSECDDKPQPGYALLGVLAPLVFLAAVFGLLVVLS